MRCQLLDNVQGFSPFPYYFNSCGKNWHLAEAMALSKAIEDSRFNHFMTVDNVIIDGMFDV